MPTQIGRISGSLLRENLLRDGVNLAFEHDLLYIDVETMRIGIRSDAPTRDLFINDAVKTTNIIIDNTFTISSNVLFDNTSSISTNFNDLIFTNDVVATRVGIGNLEFDNNSISNQITNNDIELQPDGTGKVKIVNDLHVYGSLYSTGNITVEGNIILGTDSSDVIVFNSEIDSNIIPNQTNTYKIGDLDRRWNNLYAGLLNGEVLTVDVIVPGSGTLPASRQGNIWYVMTNGNDGNVGDHPNGGFATLEKALSVAQSEDTVFIYPGIYEELLPLIVPEGVSIKGTDIRNTIIKPDTSSTTQDVFLLNGQTFISDLTIKDFYYDSINNTGHAFRFASGIKVTSRSPYIQNCTVVTRGSVTSISDPLGFDQGDAGRGAYLDGAVADPQTADASMLFHSITFITPGVDALIMKNGVRVEWSNSFTYFANRGMYALRGTGRITQDGSTLKYGAEVRSIGSANVYGNYGAEADGLDTLMYLINHNFSYIGLGKDSTNDKTLAIQANEVVELNNGKIHFTSINHKGNFRVGDNFYVDLEKGTISKNITSVIGNTVGINFEYNEEITFFDASKFETGNLQFKNNTIRSFSGPINIASASGEINFDQNVNIFKDLAVASDLNINGTITLGNESSDTIFIFPKIDENLEPKFNITYNLGSQDKNWKTLLSREAYISDIKIDTNYITTTVSNADLELRANGSGSILVEDIRVNQRSISTDSGNISITPATTLDITASTTTINGNLRNDGNFSVDGFATFGVSSAQTVNFRSLIDTDIIPNTNDEYSLGNSTQSWNLFTSQLLIDDIEIEDNYIRTTVSNLNLELKANGIGSVQVEQINFNENIIRTQGVTNLIIDPAGIVDVFANTAINGNLSITNNFNFNGSITFGGIGNTVQVIGQIDSDIIPDIGDTYNIGSLIKRWNTLLVSEVQLDDIEIHTNYIRTTVSNSNLELYGNNAGGVLAESLRFGNNVILSATFNQNIQVDLVGSSILDINTDTALRVPRGSNISMTTGDLRFSTTNNVFSGQTSARVTFGGVYSADRSSYARVEPVSNIITFQTDAITAMSVSATGITATGLNVDNISVNNNIIATNNINLMFDPDANNTVDIYDIRFDDNQISNLSNNPLIVEHSGTGYLKVDGTLGMVIPAGTNSERPGAPAQGTTRWNTDEGYLEIYIGTTWQLATASGTGFASLEDINEFGDIYSLILG